MSLPIRILWRRGDRLLTCASARPRRSAVSEVIGSTLATPRTPSVPKSRRSVRSSRASPRPSAPTCDAATRRPAGGSHDLEPRRQIDLRIATVCVPGAEPARVDADARRRRACSRAGARCGPRTVTSTHAGREPYGRRRRSAARSRTCLNSRDVMHLLEAARVTRHAIRAPSVTKSPAHAEQRRSAARCSCSPRRSIGSVVISFSSSTLLAGPVTSTWSGTTRDSATV